MAGQSFPELEKNIIEYWKKHKVFERSISERPETKPYTFYDGPPFATGLPHYGHIVASTLKDVVPRYATMRGYRVERNWGWDCHGLPVENLIEKELKLKTKQDIETMGVAAFNDACKTSVLRYTAEWKTTIERLGRWVDMENDYRTMDPNYMESVWWVFKQLFDKGLIYEGKKAMQVCPRCVTPLANFEVTLGYKDVIDTAVTWKFPVVGQAKTYLLAWTTTPWSTLGTTGLSVGPDFTYVKVKVPTEHGVEFYVLVKDRVEIVLAGMEYEIVETMKGVDLVGWSYEPVMPEYRNLPDVVAKPNSYHVFPGDYVEVTEGTGIVTINGSYGEIDMQAAKRNDLPLVIDVEMNGTYNTFAGKYAGKNVKVAQVEIITDMQAAGFILKAEPFTHSYPHCWRCDTPLLNYATTSWFVRVTQLKDDMIKNNHQIDWVPDHIKHGRFGKWLDGVKDWAISRERYWGTPLPIWKSSDGDILCVGSIAELAELSGEPITDLHKQFVDPIVIHKDGKDYRRIESVLDCWFESGSMPYAQQHYPFEHKEDFSKLFPAEFIAEGLDQTRGWFYTLTVLSTALFNQPAFKHVIVNGLVLAEDGKKMSKRLKNYPEPNLVLEKYGADALRYYLMSSPVVHAEDLRFSEKGVDLVMKKVIMTLWNVQTFYSMFAEGVAVPVEPKSISSSSVMDQWVLAYTAAVVKTVTTAMDSYDLQTVTITLEKFIQEISTWYIRRSRDRFKSSDPAEKLAALSTLRQVLLTTVKLLAPFTPFISEQIYLNIMGTTGVGDSVHLQTWPTVEPAHTNDALLSQMQAVREAVEQVLAQREAAGLKVRQPLAQVTVPGVQAWPQTLQQVLCDEVNVKVVVEGTTMQLDTTITPELAEEGMVRELVRTINALRKQKKFTIKDQIAITYQTTDQLIQTVFQKHSTQLQQSVLAKQLQASDSVQAEVCQVNGAAVTLTLIVQ